MNTHIRVLRTLIVWTAGYVLVPTTVYGLVYFGGSRLLDLHFNDDQVTEVFMDLFTIVTVVVLFRLYTKVKRHELFPGNLQVKRMIALIPISLLARIPVVLFVIGLIIFFGEKIINIFDQGLSYQWEGFDNATPTHYLFSILSYSVLGPIHEELFFRGIVYRFLKKTYSVRVSIVYSSALFALMHLHPGLYPSSIILGLILAYTYERWPNLTYPIILHMLINLHPFIISALSKSAP